MPALKKPLKSVLKNFRLYWAYNIYPLVEKKLFLKVHVYICRIFMQTEKKQLKIIHNC